MQFPEIQQRLRKELDSLNEIIRRALKVDMPVLQRIIDNYLLTKGKQIRPIMVLLSAKMAGEVTPDVLHAAAALEILHNASLIHDDVVDATERRRGLSTVNAIWDNHIAVLSGDYFVSKALAEAISTGSLSVIQSISELGSELSLGEINQICTARWHDLSYKEYFATIEKKTACLFRKCARLGAQTAGADPATVAALEEYAGYMGLCFQIKDDIFDYLDDVNIGKPTGNDLREGKVTLPLLFALKNAAPQLSQSMGSLLSQEELTAEQIATLIEFAKEQGGIAYAYQVMDELRAKAHPLVASFPDCEAKEALEEIFSYIISRNK